MDKKLNNLIYRTLFYANVYGSYKLLKTILYILLYTTKIGHSCRFLAHPVYSNQTDVICTNLRTSLRNINI